MAGSYIQKGWNSIWEKEEDGHEDPEAFFAAMEEEFSPLNEKDLDVKETLVKKLRAVQAAVVPGVGFVMAAGILSNTFKNVVFTTDRHTIRGNRNQKILSNIAQYLKKTSTYVSIYPRTC